MQLEDPLKWLSSGAALDSRGRKGQGHDGGGWLGSWVGPWVPRPPFPGRTRGPHMVWPGHPSSWSPMMRGPRLGTGGPCLSLSRRWDPLSPGKLSTGGLEPTVPPGEANGLLSV